MINVFVTNVRKHAIGIVKGGWITLPVSEEVLRNFLVDTVGIIKDVCEEYRIDDVASDIIGLEVSEYHSLDSLNAFAQKVSQMDDMELKALQARLCYDCSYSEDLLKACEYIANKGFNVYENCNDMGDVAKIIFNAKYPNVDDVIRIHMDYDSYGESLETSGIFCGVNTPNHEEDYYVEFF